MKSVPRGMLRARFVEFHLRVRCTNNMKNTISVCFPSHWRWRLVPATSTEPVQAKDALKQAMNEQTRPHR